MANSSPRYAVLDLGSNSVKFLVVEVRGESKGAPQWRILAEESLTTRLAENLIDSCELRPEAIERTLAALAELRAKAEKLGVQHYRAVATSAVRDSRNRKDFLRAAKTVLGFSIRLLSGEEEAETVFAGVSADNHWQGHDLFAFDVGGGSTEWIQGRAGRVQKRISLPLGCVRLRERFIPHYPAGEAALRLLEGVQAQIAVGLRGFQLGQRSLVGTGGTLTALAAMQKELVEYDAKRINHTLITRARAEAEFARLKNLSLEELQKQTGLPAKRADLILPGVAVVLATMQTLGASRLHVSTRGLRYGVLTQLLADTAVLTRSAPTAKKIVVLKSKAKAQPATSGKKLRVARSLS